jgi:hypothetical protein
VLGKHDYDILERGRFKDDLYIYSKKQDEKRLLNG